jgi:hypothetical protein
MLIRENVKKLIMKTDPREHFQYPACLRCFEQPCAAFRYSHEHGNKFLFVHNSRFNTLNPCPFAAVSFEEVAALLHKGELHEVDEHLRGLLSQMTADEVTKFDKSNYIGSYLDRAGRMEYLKRLWEERVFSVIRVPQPLRQDEKMRKWFENLGAAADVTMVKK